MPSERDQHKDIDNPLTWKEKGNEYFNQGQYEDAAKCYSHAIELDPDFAEAWNNLGLSLLKLGKIEEAKKCNEKVKELKEKAKSQKQTIPTIPTPQTTKEAIDTEYCQNCGSELPYKQGEWPASLPKICPSCGVRVKDPIRYGSREGQGRTHAPQLKNPILAALLSIIPGLGQAYNGQLGKAFLFLLGVIIGSFIFVIPGIIVWIYGIYHAHKTAKQMNYGDVPYKETKLLNIVGYLVLALVLGFIAIAIALSISGYLPTSNQSTSQSGLSTQQIISSAKTVPYDDLFRYNEKYIGDIVLYKGKIVQSQNTFGDNYIFRVAVKKDKLLNDYYEDIIWLNYKGSRYLEGDIIQFWGKVKGLKEYRAVLGNTVTIPEIDALIVELV